MLHARQNLTSDRRKQSSVIPVAHSRAAAPQAKKATPAWERPSRTLSAPVLQRTCACGGTCADCAKDEESGGTLRRKAVRPSQTLAQKQAGVVPPIVHDVLRSSGAPLDTATRAQMEPHFGADLSGVRVHTDAQAAKSARAVDALAYTAGNHIAFGAGQYKPGTQQGQRLLAHELTHVRQQGANGNARPDRIGAPDTIHEAEADSVASRIAASSAAAQAGYGVPLSADTGTIQRYRDEGAPHKGIADTPTLKEQPFTDPETQPWIEVVNVEFTDSTLDENGDPIPFGTATAIYHKNGVALPPVEVEVTGGNVNIGLTHPGNHVVSRIEGAGYNDVVPKDPEGPGRLRKYSKSNEASMHYAVFFYKGEALHAGSLDLGSHGCVHMGKIKESGAQLRQINYHSVAHKTRVNVTYSAKALKGVCCAQITKRKLKTTGGLEPPCKNFDPASCAE